MLMQNRNQVLPKYIESKEQLVFKNILLDGNHYVDELNKVLREVLQVKQVHFISCMLNFPCCANSLFTVLYLNFIIPIKTFYQTWLKTIKR